MREEIKYLVNVIADTANLAVIGKASYLNCRSVGEFFSTVADKGCKNINVDCTECTGMDSTFLGMLAGAALRIRKSDGTLTVINPNTRNLELIENLGLGKLVGIKQVQSEATKLPGESLQPTNASSSGILKAHENLIAADSSNLAKFEDVITFLKKEAKED